MDAGVNAGAPQPPQTDLSSPGNTPGEPLFQLSGVQLEYQGRAVLQELSLTVRRGERVALLGKSGAGKSTLLRHLRQLQSRQVAWCPQQTGLVPVLSVYHNIYMGGLHRHGHLYNLLNLIKPLPTPLAEVSAIANTLSLDEQLLTSVDRLSGGQQQRTAIGRALYQRRPVLLADEPVSALDDYQAERVLHHLSHSHDTLVLALHDIEQALRVCDRVIGLRQGRLVLDAPADRVDQRQLERLYD